MTSTTDYFTTKSISGGEVTYSFKTTEMTQMLSDISNLNSTRTTINSNIIEVSNNISNMNVQVTDMSSNLNTVINNLINYATDGSLGSLNTALSLLA